MPRGDKGAYTDKQKRKAEHIEEGYEKRGVSKKEAEARAWATVNKDSGGGNKSGSGRGRKDTNASARRGAERRLKIAPTARLRRRRVGKPAAGTRRAKASGRRAASVRR
jgi:plasmid stabilization system protein ParE